MQKWEDRSDTPSDTTRFPESSTLVYRLSSFYPRVYTSQANVFEELLGQDKNHPLRCSLTLRLQRGPRWEQELVPRMIGQIWTMPDRRFHNCSAAACWDISSSRLSSRCPPDTHSLHWLSCRIYSSTPSRHHSYWSARPAHTQQNCISCVPSSNDSTLVGIWNSYIRNILHTTDTLHFCRYNNWSLGCHYSIRLQRSLSERNLQLQNSAIRCNQSLLPAARFVRRPTSRRMTSAHERHVHIPEDPEHLGTEQLGMPS